VNIEDLSCVDVADPAAGTDGHLLAWSELLVQLMVNVY